MSFWKQYPDLTFDEKEHIYKWHGRSVPSVTGIFDRIGYRKDDKSPWNPIGCPDFAKREHDREFGNVFHLCSNGIMLENEVTIKDPDKAKEMLPWIEQVYEFKSKYPISPLYDSNGNALSEYPMYSEIHHIAGTPDFIGRLLKNGVIWIIDWKTGAYQKNYAWQTAGYEIIFREVFGGILLDKREKIVRVTVTFSPDRRAPQPFIRDNHPEDAISFKSILNTFRLAA